MADMSFYVEIKGVSELNQKLFDLGRKGWKIIGKAEKIGADYLITELRKTTRYWKRKVDFSASQPIETPGTQTITITTEDVIWNMLNKGTRPHVIVAHNPTGRLWFYAGGFVSKTTPGSLYSGPGTRASYDFRTPQSVNHPGTVARDWSGQIRRDYGDKAARKMIDYAKNEIDQLIKAV